MKIDLTPQQWLTVAVAVALGWAILATLHHFGLPDWWYGFGLGVWITGTVRAAEMENTDDDEETTP